MWIDATGPSAPTITGGSTAYALSKTISVVTEADDNGASGVAYYEYYKKSGADKPDENIEGTKVTTSATSQEFNTNIAGEYVFFRAVDVVGNKGAWSEGQQVYIDVNVPTVTCNQTNSTLTISEGDNKTLLDYFTITPTGTNKAYTAKCKVGSTEYTTTESFTAANSPYTVTCTATITGGNSGSGTMTVIVEAGQGDGGKAAAIAANPKGHYGRVVTNYTTPSGDPNVEWKIFYADSSYIYLVASDYIHYDYAPLGKDGSTTVYKNSDYRLNFDNLRKIYGGSADILNTSITDSRVLTYLTWVNSNKTDTDYNINSVAYMVDTVRWNAKYKNSTYAAYATGGPTVEMFVKSYNQIYPDMGLTYSITGTNAANGYYVGSGGATATSYAVSGLDTENSLYVISDTSKCEYWWLASPSAYGSNYLVTVADHGYLGSSYYRSSYAGFRPLVCLRQEAELYPDGEGNFTVGLTFD